MADPQQLFAEFAERCRSSDAPDPRDYLGRLEGTDREELRVLIEAFLERAPRREWDAGRFSGSLAERALARAGEAAREEEAAERQEGELAGAWPEVLPELRNHARLKRAEIVERLAAALGHPESEAKVGEYYHRMEQGLLPASGVSTRVLEALAGIVDASAATLRRAGEAGGEGGAAGGEVFARVAAGDARHLAAEAAGAEEPARESDEVDRLFTEGD